MPGTLREGPAAAFAGADGARHRAGDQRRSVTRSVLAATGAAAIAYAMLAGMAALSPAQADKISHPTAMFAGLDKITGRIISFEVAIDETVQFGSLLITPRACFTRPPTEAPHTTSFVEVEEVVAAEQFKRIFGGWMFAASPGLHGIEHAVYDAWLTDCKGGTEIIRTARPKEEVEEEPAARVEREPERQPPPPAAQLDQQPRDVAPPPGMRPPPQRQAEQQQQRRRPSQWFYPADPSRHPLDVNPFGNY